MSLFTPKLSRRSFLKNMGLLSGSIFLNANLPFSGASRVQNEEGRPLLLAHYMPWYQTPEVRGYWGWHWTMDYFNPTTTDENGRPQIASHYMPLTGPYDSSDDAILEYQVALMKISGIDGVIVDWYGMENFRDYGALNDSTNKLFEYVKKAGLLFAICYEDQTIKHMIDNGHLDREEAIPHGQEVMQYMQERWFGDDIYVKYGDHPVLFVFGPQYFKSSTDWEALFSELDTAPALVTLDKHLVSNATASYPWVPGFGIEINKEVVEATLTQFYRTTRRYDYIVGGAFPGFHDIYSEAHVQSSYGFLDAQDGEILRFTLQLALEQNPDVIQLITWNDYGEGTMIEPAEEYGYDYLEIVQSTRQQLSGSDFGYTSEDLRLPFELFQLRKQFEDNAEANRTLNTAFDSLIMGEVEDAKQILITLSGE